MPYDLPTDKTDGTLQAGDHGPLHNNTSAAVNDLDDRVVAIEAIADAVVYRGAINASANPNYPAANAGDLYRISVAGKIGGAAGVGVEAGDTVLCHVDGSAAGTQAAVGANWDIIQVNIDGAVVGPSSATADHIPQFNGTTGKLIKDGLALDTDNTLAANSDTRLPSQKAVKGYVDSGLATKQAADADLTALAGLTSGANKVPRFTGPGTADLLDFDTDAALAAHSDTRLASQKAVKDYVDAAVSSALTYKGAIDCSGNPNYPAADAGDLYQVSVAGKIGGAAGITVQIGDQIICNTNGTASGNQATVGAFWDIIANTNAVAGPAVAVDGHIPQFDGTTGKLLKDGLPLDVDGALAANSDARVPSQKAVKTYVGAYAQPLDSDLTALAALATTAFGRAVLETADAVAAQRALALVKVSSLPGTPIAGQQCFYEVVAGVIWHLLYDGVGTYPWKVVGGSPLFDEVTASEGTANTSYVALGTAGPAIALPLGGDYDVMVGAEGISSDNNFKYMSYDIGGTGAVDADAYRHSGNIAVIAGGRPRRKTGLTAVTLTAKYRAGAGTGTWAFRWMRAMPTRVG